MEKISVVIPTFNRNDLLCEAINSVVNQTDLENVEIVVVDNATNDGCSRLLATVFGEVNIIKYVKNKSNLGMVGNWNEGIRLSTGDWITILHDDDLLDQDFISTMRKYITKFPECNNFISRKRILDQREKKSLKNHVRMCLDYFKEWRDAVLYFCYETRPLTLRDYKTFNYTGNGLCHIFRRRSIQRNDAFKTEFHPSADYEFNLHLVQNNNSREIYVRLGSWRLKVNDTFSEETMAGFSVQDKKIRTLYFNDYK